MLRHRLSLILLGLLLMTMTLAAANSNKAAFKEPHYALLVFGPEAKVRVQVVLDGKTLYVDRNSDGDLTGKDERFTIDFPNGDVNKSGQVSDCNIEIRDPDGQTRYLITSFGIYPEDEKPNAKRQLMAYVDIKGRISYRQYCDAKMGESLDQAAVAHFHGPLTIGPRTISWKLTPELSRILGGDNPSDIFAVVGTMDAERGCWVVVRGGDLPKDLHPVAEVEFPANKPGDPPIKKRYRLEERC
jgi:hypothetical protein